LRQTPHDIVIIGSGVGGAAVAFTLADSGARILILERGERLPREAENWSAEAVFAEQRYRTTETWYDGSGKPFRPGQFYFVGGHTKLYGAAMFRFRERDFEGIEHDEGRTVPWPVRYADLEPWYGEAERLFGVHGKAGKTRPNRRALRLIPMVPFHMNRSSRMRSSACAPSACTVPYAGRRGHASRRHLRALRTCDAFPCRIGAKGDAETRLLDPALEHPNVTLQTGCEVTRLVTDASGERIVAAEYRKGDATASVSARLFVLCAGAINSAAVLLRSADARNPNGLANSSGVVGRYYMNHNCTGIMAIRPFQINRHAFRKPSPSMIFTSPARHTTSRWAICKCWGRSRSRCCAAHCRASPDGCGRGWRTTASTGT
jgi:choline dehydrogenase-like flavoprotein